VRTEVSSADSTRSRSASMSGNSRRGEASAIP